MSGTWSGTGLIARGLGEATGRPANLVPNGSFEQGPVDPWPLFRAWDLARAGAGSNDLVVAPADSPQAAADGEHCLLARATVASGIAPSGTVNGVRTAAFPCPYAAGTVLRLRASRWFLTAVGGANVAARLTVEALDASGAVLSALATVDRATQEASWAVIDQTITATPAGTASLRVTCGFVATANTGVVGDVGTCLWDNVYVDLLFDATGVYARGRSADSDYYVVSFSGRPSAAAATTSNYALNWAAGSAVPVAATRGNAGGVDDNRVLLKFATSDILAPGGVTANGLPPGAPLTVNAGGTIVRASDSQAVNNAVAGGTAHALAVPFAQSFEGQPVGALAVGPGPADFGIVTISPGGSGTLTVQRATALARDRALAVTATSASALLYASRSLSGGPRGVLAGRWTLLLPGAATPAERVIVRALGLTTGDTMLTFGTHTSGATYQATYNAAAGGGSTVTIAATAGSDATTPRCWSLFAVLGDGFGVLEFSKDGTRVLASGGLAHGHSQQCWTADWAYGMPTGAGSTGALYLDDLLVANAYLAPPQATTAGTPGLTSPPILHYGRDGLAAAALGAQYDQYEPAGLAVQSGGSHFGARALAVTATATTMPALRARWAGAAPATLYARFWLALTAATAATELALAAWPGVAQLRRTPEGRAALVDAYGNRLATTATIPADGSWHAYEVYLAPAGAATTGTLWVDGAQVATSAALHADAADFAGGVVLGAGDYGAWSGTFNDWWLSSAYCGPGYVFASGFEGAALAPAWSTSVGGGGPAYNTPPAVARDPALVRSEQAALLVTGAAGATGEGYCWARGSIGGAPPSVWLRAWVRVRALASTAYLLEIDQTNQQPYLQLRADTGTGTYWLDLLGGQVGAQSYNTGYRWAADDAWRALEIAIVQLPRSGAGLPGMTEVLRLWVDGTLRFSTTQAGVLALDPGSVLVGFPVPATGTVLYDDVAVASLGPIGPGPATGALGVAAVTGTTASVSWGPGTTPVGWPAMRDVVLDVTSDPRGVVRWEEGGGLDGAPAATDNGVGSAAGLPASFPVVATVTGKPLSGLATDAPLYGRVRWRDAAGHWAAAWVAFTPRHTVPGPTPPARPAVEVRLLDANLQTVGILARYESLRYTRRVNTPGAFELHGGVFAGNPGLTRVADNAWLQVWRDGGLDFMAQVRHRKFTLAAASARGAWALEAIGQTYEAQLAGRLAAYGIALSGITSPPWGTFATATDLRTGQADQILAQYVDFNAGPSCPNAAARLPFLTVPTPATTPIVPTRTYEARLENLLELCQKFAAWGFDFALAPDATGQSFSFRTYAPRLGTDRSIGNAAGRAPVIFAPEMGTVSDIAAWQTALEVYNHYLVGGAGDGAARLFQEVSDPASVAAWGQGWAFLNADQSSTATTANQQAALVAQGEAALDAHGPVIGSQYTVVPASGARYKDDWDLGDFVTVQAADIGLQLVDTVSEVEVTLAVGNGDTAQEQVRIVTGRPPKRLFNQLLYANRQSSAAGRR